MIVLIFPDGARREVIVEGDVSMVVFSMVVINNRLLILNHATDQSFHVFPCKKKSADEKSMQFCALEKKTLEY